MIQRSKITPLLPLSDCHLIRTSILISVQKLEDYFVSDNEVIVLFVLHICPIIKLMISKMGQLHILR